MKNNTIDYSLYLVTDRGLLGGKDLLLTVEKAIQGGVTILQMREKDVPTSDFYNAAMDMHRLAHKYKVPFIINDRVDVALAVNADGVHIGQDDMPLLAARKLLGPEKIIGVSVSTLAQAMKAQEEGADYLGIGAIFPTGTKADADSVSLDELKIIRENVNTPIIAIGGIQENNVKQVMQTGVQGVAVVSAIIAKSDPYQAAVNLKNLLKN